MVKDCNRTLSQASWTGCSISNKVVCNLQALLEMLEDTVKVLRTQTHLLKEVLQEVFGPEFAAEPWAVTETEALAFDLSEVAAQVDVLWSAKQEVIVHSDQGSQYASCDYREFLTTNNLVPSMSRRVHCLDNAVAESFFHSLKTERVKRKVYESRNEARADLFDYIEMFYNRKRLHSHLGHVSPDEYENQFLTGS